MAARLASGGRAGRLRAAIRGPADVALLCRMAGWATLFPLLKHVVSLDRLARLAWSDPSDVNGTAIAKVLALTRVLSLPRSKGSCYERSLLAYRFLARGGHDPRLVVAVAKRDTAVTAHAWVTVGGRAIGESDAIKDFAPMVAYGRGGRREAVAAASAVPAGADSVIAPP